MQIKEEVNTFPNLKYRTILYVGRRNQTPKLTDTIYEGSNFKIIDKIEENKKNKQRNYPALLVWETLVGERRYATIDFV